MDRVLTNDRSRLLVRNPNVMNRLRSEISSVMGDENHPTREKIRRMPYLANVITESKFPPYSFDIFSCTDEVTQVFGSTRLFPLTTEQQQKRRFFQPGVGPTETPPSLSDVANSWCFHSM